MLVDYPKAVSPGHSFAAACAELNEYNGKFRDYCKPPPSPGERGPAFPESSLVVGWSKTWRNDPFHCIVAAGNPG